MELRLGNLRSGWCALVFWTLFVPAIAAEWKETRVLGTAGFQHAGTISEVFALPDGKSLVTACADGSARLWEIESGKELQRYAREDTDTIWTVRLLAGGEQILSAGDDGYITLWETATGKKLMTYEQEATVFRLAVRPGEKEFAAVDADNRIVLWNVATGEKVRTFEGHSESVYTAVFLSKGDKLLTGGSDGKVKRWNVETGECERTLKEDYDNVYTLVVSPDKTKVALCTSDNRVCLLEANTLKTVWSEKLENGAKVVTWSRDGRSIIGASSGDELLFLSAQTGQVTKQINIPDASHRGVGSSWDGKEIFVGCDGVLARFSSKDQKRIEPALGLPVFAEEVKELVITSDGTVVYGYADGGKVEGWKTETGENLNGFEISEEVNSMVMSPDDQLLALGYNDGKVELVDRDPARVVRTLLGDKRGGRELDGRVSALAFNPKGTVLVAGSSRDQILSWDVKGGRTLRAFEGHEDDVNDVLISPDGETLMSVSDDKTVRLWSLNGGKEIKKLRWNNERVEAIVSLERGRSFLVTGFGEELRGHLMKEGEKETMLSPEEIKELIKQLEAEAYADRKLASTKLIKQGAAAMPYLEAARSDDPEAVFRIREIMGKIRRGGLGSELKSLHSFSHDVEDLSADSQGNQWAVVLGKGVFSQIAVGEVADQKLVITQTIPGGRGAVRVEFSANGQKLSVGNADGTISIFEKE